MQPGPAWCECFFSSSRLIGLKSLGPSFCVSRIIGGTSWHWVSKISKGTPQRFESKQSQVHDSFMTEYGLSWPSRWWSSSKREANRLILKCRSHALVHVLGSTPWLEGQLKFLQSLERLKSGIAGQCRAKSIWFRIIYHILCKHLPQTSVDLSKMALGCTWQVRDMKWHEWHEFINFKARHSPSWPWQTLACRQADFIQEGYP